MTGSHNEPDDPRVPDPDAAVLDRTDDEDPADSLQPGADTKDGPRGDDARTQPYDEQPIGLRMHDDQA